MSKIDPLNVAAVREALRRAPRLVDPGADGAESEDPSSVLDVLVQVQGVLRKLGLQQARSGREVVGTVESLAERMTALQEAARREQERAAEREEQLRALSSVLVGVVDLLGRQAEALAAGGDPADLADQVRVATERLLRDAARAGLVAIGLPGETFDPAVHDLVDDPGGGAGGVYEVRETITVGFRLNGRTLRKARVCVAPRAENQER